MSLGASFWKLLTSSGLSNVADGILKTALPLVALQYTRSPALIALLALVETLPWLLFALPAGALTDRIDRRLGMLGANAFRGGLLVVLTVLLVLDAGALWMLYVVAFLIGISETVYDTAAQSILPQVVPRSDLPAANARLYSVELTANAFVGPPIGGLLVAVGAALAIGTPAALWLVAIGVLWMVKGRFRVDRTVRTSLRADIAEGMRFLWRHRLLRTLASMVGVMNLAGNMSMAVFVLYAVGSTSAMGLSEPGYGMFLAGMASGGLVGSLFAVRIVRVVGRARCLRVMVFFSGACLLSPALTANVWILGTMFALWSAAIAVWNVITVSLRQHVTPDALLGRVNSCYRLVAWGTQPVGALFGGLLGELFGLRPTFAVSAVVALTALVGALLVTDRAMDEAEAAAP